MAPNESLILYILLCGMVDAGDYVYAMDLHEKSVDNGLSHPARLEHDPDMDPLRKDPRFVSATEKMLRASSH